MIERLRETCAAICDDCRNENRAQQVNAILEALLAHLNNRAGDDCLEGLKQNIELAGVTGRFQEWDTQCIVAPALAQRIEELEYYVGRMEGEQDQKIADKLVEARDKPRSAIALLAAPKCLTEEEFVENFYSALVEYPDPKVAASEIYKALAPLPSSAQSAQDHEAIMEIKRLLSVASQDHFGSNTKAWFERCRIAIAYIEKLEAENAALKAGG